MAKRVLFLLLTSVLSTAVLTACGGSGGGAGDGGVDATPDAVADAVVDATPDAVADAAMDAVADATPDAVADATMDAVADATPDAVADATMDAVADATPDAMSDAAIDCATDMCPSGFFCRDRMSGGRECAPYRTEGESCGGFVPSWAQTRCEPELSCLAPNPLIADGPGICAWPATLAQLASDPGTYDGHVVGVLEAWVVLGPGACTELACSASMPCCNTCQADELLAPAMTDTMGVRLLKDDLMGFRCLGDDCDPAVDCEVAPDLQYRVFGAFNAGTNSIVVSSIVRSTF